MDPAVDPRYQYDHNGNPTLYQNIAMAFDPENHLTRIGASGSPHITAGYNGDGLRAWKETHTTGRTYYVYDGATPIVEVDSNDGVQAVNSFGGAGLLSRRNGGVNGPTTCYIFDPQGNVCQRLDSTGTPTSTDMADAFGIVYRMPNLGMTDAFSFGGQWGYYNDWDSGLNIWLLTNRYYDPASAAS